MSPDREVPLWEPTPADRERAWLTGFMQWRASARAATFAEYEQLREWPVTELERFWGSIWEYFGVRCSHPYEQVLGRSRRHSPTSIPRSTSIPVSANTRCQARVGLAGRKLNYAENMLAPATPAASGKEGPAAARVGGIPTKSRCCTPPSYATCGS